MKRYSLLVLPALGIPAMALENTDSNSTIPSACFTRSFGNVPVGLLHPFMLTGRLSSHVGVIAQLHLYSGDMFPDTLANPIGAWF
jgi:hypothetical protein